MTQTSDIETQKFMHEFTDNKLEILFGWIMKLDCKILKLLCKLNNTKICMGGQI